MICQERDITPSKEVCLVEDFQTPEMQGTFFCPITGFESMEDVDLMLFYNFGKEMRTLTLEERTPLKMVTRLVSKQVWLDKFVTETADVPFPKSRKAIAALRAQVVESTNFWAERINATGVDSDSESIELARIRTKRLLEDFEKAFDHECSQSLSVFAVTPKGDKSTRILIEEPELKFPKRLLPVMPANVMSDLKEAGKCLAFERATACAFHGCRATEGLMRAYYKKLTGYDWPPPPPKPKMNKDWSTLVNQLGVEHAPAHITQRLQEIREDRNSFAHPEITVSLDNAIPLYDLCTNIMQEMAEEMV